MKWYEQITDWHELVFFFALIRTFLDNIKRDESENARKVLNFKEFSLRKSGKVKKNLIFKRFDVNITINYDE